jgi:hypothetical protein
MGVEQSNKAVAASTTGSAIAAGISQEVSALDASRSNVLSMAARVSAQLEALQERARTGSPEDVERLGKWAALAEQESNLLRRRLRKQQHDFATFFEIVGQTSARALDVVAMQTYLLRTISGHFATPKLMIMRRMRPEDQALTLSAAQGVRAAAHQRPLPIRARTEILLHAERPSRRHAAGSARNDGRPPGRAAHSRSRRRGASP